MTSTDEVAGVPDERTTAGVRQEPGAPDGRFAPGAWRLATVPVVLAMPLAFVAPPAVPFVAALGAAAVLWFHRDPDRSVPAGDGVIAPADGTVSVVRETGDGRLRVGTYMSGLDVHVNRTPVDGRVTTVEHRPGANRLAFSKDSDRNERVHVEIVADGGHGSDESGTGGSDEAGDGNPTAANGETYAVDLIAGAFARRIHPYVEPGDRAARGQRLGHISFGSRVDVVFPHGVDRSALAVSEGDTVRAGETVIAKVEPVDTGAP
jgi:phosphatidylserine decarboxylase